MLNQLGKNIFNLKPFEYSITIFISLLNVISFFVLTNHQTYISNTKKIALITGFFLLFFLNLLLYLKLVKPAFQRMSSSHFLILLLICLLGSIYLSTFFPLDLYQIHLFPEKFSIELDNENHEITTDRQIILTGFSTDAIDVSFDSLASQSWVRTGNELHTNSNNFTNLYWRGYVNKSLLTFKTGPQGTKFNIFWNNNKTTFDTWSETLSELRIEQEHAPTFIENLLVISAFLLNISWVILLLSILNILVWKSYPVENKKDNSEGKIFSLILAILSFILFLILSRNYETLITTDSSSYLHCGRQLAAGNGYISGDGDVYVWWGPLYPGIITLLNFLPPDDVFLKIRLLNALLYSATIFLTGMIYHDLLKPKTNLQKSGLLFIPAAGWFLISFTYLLSEPLFIFLSLLFFYAFNKYLDTKKRRWVFVFTLAACGHILTRYNGVTLAISACLVILIFFKESLKNRLLKAFSFGISSTAPLVLWLAHNFYLKHMLTGKRPKASLSLLDNIKLASNVISRWFLPFKWEFMTLLILTIFCVILLLLFIKKKSEQKFDPQIKVSLLLVFSVSFLSQMIISLSIIENTPLNNRLLSAVYIPITLGFCWIFQKLFFYIKKKFPGLPYRAAAVILLCSLFFQPLISYKEFNEIKTQPVSNSFFYSKFFEQSQITEYLKQIKIEPDQLWYSNCARCTLVFSEKLTLIFEPYSSNKKGYLPDGNKAFFLVWFTDFYAEGINQKLEPITEIKNLTDSPLQIKELHEFNDGNIYFVLPIKED